MLDNKLLIFWGFIFNLVLTVLIANEGGRRKIGLEVSFLIGFFFGFIIQFMIVILSPFKNKNDWFTLF